MDNNSLSHTKRNYKYHIVFAHKYGSDIRGIVLDVRVQFKKIKDLCHP